MNIIKDKDTRTIKFITTSDIHGAIFRYDFIENIITSSSLSQIYAYVKEQRENSNQETVLLDNGDMLQGQPIVYYSNYQYQKGKKELPHICSEVMNFMKYDAATIGNHDIEAGHNVYDELIKEFNFPWLAANAINNITKEPYFQPYTLINKNDIKIAVLGLITPAIPNWLPEKIWEGIEFEDMIVSAKKWIKYIKEKENPDITIGLFHSGVNYKYNNQTDKTYKNENASLLIAEQVPGFDIIFAGHDHQEHNLLIKNCNNEEVLLLDPKSLAKYVSVATVTLEFDEKKKKFVKDEITGINLEMNFCEADPDFNIKFENYKKIVKKYVAEPITVFTRSVSSKDALFGNTAFIDLIHRIQLDITKAHISFAAPLSFDARIFRGGVFIRDMFKIYKFENLLYTIRLSGQEIKDYLEFSYDNWFNTMKRIDDPLLNFIYNKKGELLLKGKYYNFSSAAGIKYTVDLQAKPYNKIHISEFANGNPFDLDKDYIIAINSYRANGGGGHLIEGSKIPHEHLLDRILTKSDQDLRTLILKWIKKKGVVTPRASGNWRAIPTNWWRKGKTRSLRIINYR